MTPEESRELAAWRAAKKAKRPLSTRGRIHWGQSKLTPAQREDIRRRAWAGERAVDLAREFGIHSTTVSAIKRRTGSYGP